MNMSSDLSCNLKVCIEALSGGKKSDASSASSNGGYRKQYNKAVLMYQNCQYMQSKQLLKELFEAKIEDDSKCFGLHTRIAFLYIDSILKSGRCLSVLDAPSVATLDTVFSKLNTVSIALTHHADCVNRVPYVDLEQVLLQLQKRNAKLFDITQVLGVTVYVHNLIYRSKVSIACGDFVTARNSIHSALELFRVYLLGVLQSPAIVLFDGLNEMGTKQRVCGLLWDYCLCSSPVEESSVAALLSLTIRIKQLLSVGTVLCARVENHLNNSTLAQLLLSEPALHAPPIITTSECLQMPGSNAAELRNNEACVALRRREYHRAAALFNQALRATTEAAHATMFRLCLRKGGETDEMVVGVRQGEMAGGALCGRLYNAGLALLKLSKPVDAFYHFSAALRLPGGVISSLAERPHIWLRLADCCLQSFEKRNKCAGHSADSMQQQSVESVALGKSRRVFLNFQTRAKLVDGGAGVSDSSSAVDGEIDSKMLAPSDETPPPPSCSLPGAVLYLGRALQCIEKARQYAEQPPLLQILEGDVLVRLTFALLKSGRLHEGLETARRLHQTLVASGVEATQNSYLGAGYMVELLCALGRQDEAADFLKKHCQVPLQSCDVLLGCDVGKGSLLHPKIDGERNTHENRTAIAAAALQVNKAIALLSRGMTSAALTVAEGALRTSPNYGPALRCVLFIYLRQGRNRQALAVLNVFKQASALP